MSASPAGPIPLLYILHCGNLYGTERMALATLEGLADYRRVVVAPPSWGSASVSDEARRAGYEVVTFRGRFDLARHLLGWFVRHRRIDVIGTGVLHTALCHVLGRLLFVKVRQLHVAHGGTPSSFDQKRALNRLPVSVVAVSRFVREQLIERQVRPDRIVVIDNFLSNEQVQAGVPRPPYDSPSSSTAASGHRQPFRVAVVSRVDPMKRVDVLVEAIERHGLGDFDFDVYGVGTALDDLRTRTAERSNIRFHGYVPDVGARLAQCDLLLQLCPEEPFGLVILEAFLARLVVVVPDAGGSGGLVDDGLTGFRFRANDVDDLTRVLRRVRDLPPADRQRIAEAGRATLSARFSVRHGAQRYREALAEAP